MKTIALYLALISSNFNVQLNEREIMCMSTAIYSEARGESLISKVAVGQVILNRVYHEKHPDSICEVVYEPWQFSYIERAKPDYNSKAWKDSVKAAVHTQAYLVDDVTYGSTMYANFNLVTPRWDFSKLEKVGKVGAHTFYKEI